MRISFSPQRRDDILTVSRSGDVLTINGAAFDFSALPNGETVQPGVVPCEWIIGPVSRIGGELNITLILPHGPNPPASVAFPPPIINPADGAISLPPEEEI